MKSAPWLFSSVQSLSRVWVFMTAWITACQASLSITSSWSLHKLMSIESVMLLYLEACKAKKQSYVKHRDGMVCTVSCQIKVCLRLYHLAANFTFQRWASQKWINFMLHINYSDDFRDLEKSHITFWDTLSRWEKWYTSGINWTASCA